MLTKTKEQERYDKAMTKALIAALNRDKPLMIRIDGDVKQYLWRKQKARESYNKTLRRLLGLDK